MKSVADEISCGEEVTLTVNINSSDTTHYYIWQESTNGGQDWQSANLFSGNSTSNEITVKPTKNGIQYRAIIGDIATCPVQITVIGNCDPFDPTIYSCPDDLSQTHINKVCQAPQTEEDWQLAGWNIIDKNWETLDGDEDCIVSGNGTTCKHESLQAPAGEWKAVYDNDSVYFYVRVYDSNPKNEVGNWWNDAVEVYINNQTQYGYTYYNQSGEISTYGNGINKGTYQITKSTDYWDLRVAIPIAGNNINLSEGSLMMEVAINQSNGDCNCRSAQYFTWRTGNHYEGGGLTPVELLDCMGTKAFLDSTQQELTANDTISCGDEIILNARITSSNPNHNYEWEESTDGGNTWWTALTTGGDSKNNNVTVKPSRNTIQYRAKLGAVFTCPVIINATGEGCKDKPLIISIDKPVICPGSSAVLTVNIENPAEYSYFWEPTGETTESITVSPDSTTTYRLIVKDQTDQIVASDTVVVTVSNTLVKAEIIDQDIEKAIIAATEGMSYSWNPGGSASRSITVTPIPSAPQEYTVIVTKDGASCRASVILEPDTIIPPKKPVILLPDTSICKGSSVTLTPTIEMGSGSYTYLWSTGATTPGITVDKEDTYWVKVTDVITQTFEEKSITVTIRQAAITQIDNNNNSLTLTASGGETYEWQTGATTPTITVYRTAQATTYYVKICDRYGVCCNDSVTVPAINDPIPPIPEQMEVEIQGNPRICKGDFVILTAAVSNGSGSYTYHWKDGQTAPSITIFPNESTIYWVTVTDSDGNSVTASIQIEVMSVQLISQGTNGALLKATGGDYYVWSWTTDGIDYTAEGESVYVSPKKKTTYKVTATSTSSDSLFCVDSITISPILPPCEEQAYAAININHPTCGNNGSINLVLNEASAVCSIVWKTESGEELSRANALTGISAGKYIARIDCGTVKCASEFEVIALNSSEGGLAVSYYEEEACDRINLNTTQSPTITLIHESVPEETGSVRWTGYITPPCTGTYTFYKSSNVAGTLEVNHSQPMQGQESVIVNLSEGQSYPIIYELNNYSSSAYVNVEWKTPCINSQRESIPSCVLRAEYISKTSENCPCEIPEIYMPAELYICEGEQSVQLDALAYGSYLWSTGETSPSITVTQSGIYSLTVENNGCRNTKDVVVHSATDGSVGVSKSDESLCYGDSAELEAFGGNTYRWYPGDFLSDPTIANPVAAPLYSMTYTVDITTAGGCIVTRNVDVVVSEPFNITVNENQDVIDCLHKTITLTAEGADYYKWSPTDGLSCLNSECSEVEYTIISDKKNFTVTGFKNGCRMTDVVTVSTDIDASVTLVRSRSVTDCTVDFYATPGFDSYVWEFGDTHTLTTTSNTVSHKYDIYGEYNVCVTAKNEINCPGDIKRDCRVVFINSENCPCNPCEQEAVRN